MCYLLLFYTTTMNHFSNGLWCANKKWILLWQSVMTSSVVWPRRSSKAFLKAKCSPKKVHCHFLVVCCWPDPLQLSESWWNHCIWEICSANRWDAPKTATPAAIIGQQKGPNSSPSHTWHKPMLQQFNELGYEVLPHPPYSLDLSTSDYHFFKHLKNLLQGKHFQTRRRQKMLSSIHRIPKHGFLCYGSKLISHWQKYVDCNGPYFD